MKNIVTNKCCHLITLIFLTIACSTKSRAIDSIGYISNCQPCSINTENGGENFSIYFNLTSNELNEKYISTIDVKVFNSNKHIQTLNISPMEPIQAEDNFYFEAEDINFDGLKDIYLITSIGSANAYADYWIYSKSDEHFNYLGNFPIFKIDNKSKTLSTYERHGSGGMEYEKKIFMFLDNELKVIESEEQHREKNKRNFLKIRKKLKNNILEVVSKETILN